MRMWRSLIVLLAMTVAAPAMAQTQAMTFVMESFPPFIVDDHGRGAGPFPEVVQAVCEAMKVQCVLKLLPWRRAYAMAEAGAVDGIFVLARNAEREKSFHFTDQVFASSFVVFARDPAYVYALPQDLGGVTVATYGPSAVSQEIANLARAVPDMHLEVEIDNRVVLRKLHAGRYPEPAAAVMNKEVGLHLIAQDKLAGIRIAGLYKPVAYGIGLSRKKVSQQQAQRFNSSLRELIRQGTVKTIANKYGMTPAS